MLETLLVDLVLVDIHMSNVCLYKGQVQLFETLYVYQVKVADCLLHIFKKKTKKNRDEQEDKTGRKGRTNKICAPQPLFALTKILYMPPPQTNV